MPAFHFQLRDGNVEPLEGPVELADVAQARLHAVRCAAEVLKAQPERVIGHDLRVEVSTSEGLLLFTVIAIGVDSAAAQLDRS
jgi:hypothetical protein